MLKFGILTTSIDYRTQFVLSTCILELGVLVTCLYCEFDIFTILSYGFLLPHHCYDIALCFEPFRRMNKAFRCWIIFFYIIEEWISILLLRFCLSVDYWVVNPQHITCLHYSWEILFCFSHMFECILDIIALVGSLSCHCLYFGFLLIYTRVGLFFESHISRMHWLTIYTEKLIIPLGPIRMRQVDIIYTMAFIVIGFFKPILFYFWNGFISDPLVFF